MPIIPNQPWPSPRPAVDKPSDLAETVDAAVLQAVQRVRALRIPGAVDGSERQSALMGQRAELMVWLPLIAPAAWIAAKSVEQIINALARPDQSPEEQAAVTARIDGAVAGTIIPAFPGITQSDVDTLDGLPYAHRNAKISSQLKKIQKELAPDSPAIKEAVADLLGSYLDQSFKTAVIFFKRAWGHPYRDGTFSQAQLGLPSAEVNFATRQIAVGNVNGLTHLYTWQQP